MAWLPARLKIAQDAAGTGVNQVIWYKGAAGSEAVATEIMGTPTAITLGAATTAAPSVVGNAASAESPAATAEVIVTAWAFGAAGVAWTTPNRFASAKTVPLNSTLAIEAGGLTENLAQLSGPPV